MKLNNNFKFWSLLIVAIFIFTTCEIKNEKSNNTSKSINLENGIRSNVTFKNISAQTEIFNMEDSILVKINFDQNDVVPTYFSLIYFEDLIYSDSIFRNQRVVGLISEGSSKRHLKASYTIEEVQKIKDVLYENRVYKKLVEYILYKSDNQLLSVFDAMIKPCDSIKATNEKSFVKLLKDFSYEVCLNDDGNYIQCFLGLYSQIQYYQIIEDPTEGLLTKNQYKELERIIIHIFDIGGFNISHDLENKQIKKVRHSYACMGMKVDEKRY